jgi:ParB family transcriptional regulator, chromosome partitioning protein
MTEKRLERRGLGRGLSALMADVGPAVATSTSPARAEHLIAIDRISPNPDQPRRSFPEDALDDLAASIREKGIIQPLILRADPRRPDGFQIVAGERRWRAAQRAQLHEVPAIVRDLDDTEVLEVAIIENIQRADLNPVEEAASYRQLMDRFGHTQERMAEALGKSRSHIANMLRLLNLAPDTLALLRDGKITTGHARALLTAQDPSALARRIVDEGLSVRETERLAKEPPKDKGGAGPKGKGRAAEKDADTRALENDLAAALGMTVSIDHDAGGEAGRLTVRYRSFEELDELCRRLSIMGDVLAD